ncbi:unnamed protein product [Gongylonema pulchrum]|uniref:Piwi domain-containing protein n=1 Tax=Gongylonema pulchrum TaxID=637853 RepID=A0A183D047_9BILA|nr:unnamed protein product [Gongylonema pulchrum]
MNCGTHLFEFSRGSIWITEGNTLIIGYDVCHPEPQIKRGEEKGTPKSPSVLGISFNGASHPGMFIGDYAFQTSGAEQVPRSILKERARWILRLFHESRKKLPETVIIIRDGVSEGQYRMVMCEEVNAIRDGLRESAYEINRTSPYRPKIVCIIVCKRHSKRFAIKTDKGFVNCVPLTVIDRDVTRPDTTEFFMQSHRITMGTGKMPAYTVLINEKGLEMDEVQSLLMALCYTHQIITQAVSIPEPVFQAHEWAKRGSNIFKARASERRPLPRTEDGEYDWERITRELCRMGTQLQSTRSNA